jgi:hypothetical protein
MPREICILCRRAYEIDRNGVYGIEFEDKERTNPRQIWNGDILRCSTCNTYILRLADSPFIRSHEVGWDTAFTRAHQSAYVEFY